MIVEENPSSDLEKAFEEAISGADAIAPGEATATGAQREVRSGVVLVVSADSILVEFGPRSQGACPRAHFETPPEIGSSVEFVVEGTDRDGMLMLSRSGTVQKARWDALDAGQVVEARCTGTNKGGLEMEVAGHAAFMPAGQVDLYHVPDLTVMVGEKFACEVVECDRSRGRVVLSRRRVLQEEQAAQRVETLKSLEPGASVAAVITSLKPYGAFADIGGIQGLIHVSEMAWQRVSDPAQLVSVGDHVQVQILSVDLEQDPTRIALGMKQLLTDPFQDALTSLAPGATVSGTVTRLADFGAFVEIEAGIEGLIHVSELANERVGSPSSVVKVGQEVTVKVLSVDGQRRRIALSLKQAADGGSGEARADDPAMRKLRDRFDSGPLKGGLG